SLLQVRAPSKDRREKPFAFGLSERLEQSHRGPDPFDGGHAALPLGIWIFPRPVLALLRDDVSGAAHGYLAISSLAGPGIQIPVGEHPIALCLHVAEVVAPPRSGKIVLDEA